MLHELLLALLGKTGNIVVEDEDTFKINPKIDFIAEPEKKILNKLCVLGFYYQRIQNFLDENHKLFSDLALQMMVNTKEGDDEHESQSDNKSAFGNSSYIKAFCYGVEEMMSDYKEKILEIEETYLKERVFTISSLNVKLSDYFYVLPEINFLIDKILEEGNKGGQVIDLLNTGMMTGNAVLRDMYKRLIKFCYKVLFHQVVGWVVYGKLLDYYNEFFIYKVENRKQDPVNIQNYKMVFNEEKKVNLQEALPQKGGALNKGNEFEADWDSVFSLRFSMLPQSILSIKLAEKILFIGKAQRVLNHAKKSNEIFSAESMKIMAEFTSSEIIDTLLFQNIVEKLKQEAAIKLMDLILEKEKLIEHLANMKQYYLLGYGAFFQTFAEESRSIMRLPPTANAENDINSIAYQNTLMKLNLDESSLVKNLKFKINTNGFEFSSFTSLIGLSVLGNVTQRANNNYIRFETTKTSKDTACAWYNIKQSVENGFKMSFALRFKRSPAVAAKHNISKMLGRTSTTIDNPSSPHRMSIESPFKIAGLGKEGSSHTSVCLIIQNNREIVSWKKNAPVSLKEMAEYVAIRINLADNSAKAGNMIISDNCRSSISVSYFSKDKAFKASQKENLLENKEVKLGEVMFDNETVNFAEEDLHLFKLTYDCDNLYVFKDEYNPSSKLLADTSAQNDKPCLKIPLKLSQLLNLDMGRAYVGFVQDSYQGSFYVDVLSWKMVGYNVYNSEDAWNGLTVDYNIKWPLNLLLSSQIMEKYSNLFRYLFPIRFIQTELHKTWLSLTKNNRLFIFDKTYIKLLHLRNQMSFFIDNLWSYFHLDVLGAQWQKLEQLLNKVKDFDELRKAHQQYLIAIYNQVFLSIPKIVKSIFTLVNQCRRLVGLVQRADSGMTKKEIASEYENIKDEYEKTYSDMLGIITLLNKNNNSPYLFQLLLRLDYNRYYSDITEGFRPI